MCGSQSLYTEVIRAFTSRSPASATIVASLGMKARTDGARNQRA